MLTLIHGDNQEQSRSILNEIKHSLKGRDIRELNGGAIDQTSLSQALESQSLFGQDTLVIIENLYSKLSNRRNLFRNLCSIISRTSIHTDMIIWEDREWPKGFIKLLGKIIERLCKISPIIFLFLDEIRPQNAKNMLTLLKSTLKESTPEQIFFMMVRRNRQLLMMKDGVIPDTFKPWQIRKLQGQLRHFNKEQLVNLHKKYLDIEYSVKSGKSPMQLTSHIRRVLIDI